MTHKDWERPNIVSLMNMFWEKTFELRPNFSEDLSKEGMRIYENWLNSIDSTCSNDNIEETILAMAESPTVDDFHHLFRSFQQEFVDTAQAIDCYSNFRCELENYLAKFNLTAEWCPGYAERQLWYWFNNRKAFEKREVFTPSLLSPFSEEERLRIERDVHFDAKPPGSSNRPSKLGSRAYWEFRRWKSLISVLANLLTDDKRIPLDQRWRLSFLLRPEFWIRYCINGLEDELLIDLFRNCTPWPNFPFMNEREWLLMPGWMSDEEKYQHYYDNNPQEIPSALQFHFRDFWWIDRGEEIKDAKKRIEAKFKVELKEYLDSLEKEGIRPLYPEEFSLVPDEEFNEMNVEQNLKIKTLHVEWAVRRIVPPIESKNHIDRGEGNVDHTHEIGEFSNSVAGKLGLETPGSLNRRGKSIHH